MKNKGVGVCESETCTHVNDYRVFVIYHNAGPCMLWDLALFGFLTDWQSDQTVPLPLSYKALNSALLKCEAAASIYCPKGQESLTSSGHPQTSFFSAPQASSSPPSW